LTNFSGFWNFVAHALQWAHRVKPFFFGIGWAWGLGRFEILPKRSFFQPLISFCFGDCCEYSKANDGNQSKPVNKANFGALFWMDISSVLLVVSKVFFQLHCGIGNRIFSLTPRFEYLSPIVLRFANTNRFFKVLYGSVAGKSNKLASEILTDAFRFSVPLPNLRWLRSWQEKL